MRNFCQRCLVALAGLVLGLSVTLAQAAEPVRIGFSIAKTGLFAKAADSQFKTYEFWRDRHNAAGGLDVGGERRMVEFTWYDDESNPAKSAQIYEKLITDDKVDLLLPPWGTPFHLAVSGVVEKHKFPLVGNTAASVALRQQKLNYMWFVTPAIPDAVAPSLAELAKSARVTKAAVLTNVLPFSQENREYLLPALKKQGIEVVVDEQYPPDIKDMTPLLTKVKQSGADAVIGLSYPDDSFLYMAQAKELGVLDIPFQFLLVGPTIPAFKLANGDAVNGLVALGHWSRYGKVNESSKEFYQAYYERFKEEPDYLDTTETYVSLQIFEQAVAEAGTDHEKLRETVANGSFETIAGTVRFIGIANATVPAGFLQFQEDGVFVVWPKDRATRPYRSRN